MIKLFVLLLSGLCYNRFNENLSELVAIASQLAIALAATLVEHEHLVTLDEWNKYFEHNLCAFHCGRYYTRFLLPNSNNYFAIF